MTNQLLEIVGRIAGRRILVVGDFMLDRYVTGDAARISPEAPVPVLRVTEREDRVGGAGSVALNVQALGAEAFCFGLLGDDRFGERARTMLNAAGADTHGLLVADDRPTITKTRLVGLAEHRHRQQLLRVDDERILAPSPADGRRLLERIQGAMEAGADVLCLEDYAKGVLTDSLCAEIIAMARARRLPVLVDPGRVGGWGKYRGATTMTPNRAELEIGVGRPLADDALLEAARQMVADVELESLVTTLGRDGALLVRKDGSHERVPTTPRAVYDNTGAGDAVLAMMAVSLAAGAQDVQAVRLANIAGGLEVEKFGCVPIPREEVVEEIVRGARQGRGKLRSAEDLVPELDGRRQRGETVVFTNGCYDLLHPGHVELLEQAKSHGSILVVGVNSDASVRTLEKGADRPIRQERDRARMLSALACVDYVVIFDAPTPARLIEQLGPDVLVKGADWAGKGVVGQDVVESRGGRVELVELVDGFSTTGELERIRAGMEAAQRR